MGNSEAAKLQLKKRNAVFFTINSPEYQKTLAPQHRRGKKGLFCADPANGGG
jgi:hypothetical protein